MEICFIPDDDYAGFIDKECGNLVPPPGNFVSKDGKILGRHKGITHYTVGQRKGLGIALGYPVFVTEIRPETNEVVLGSNEDVFTTELYADHVNFMSIPDIEGEVKLKAKIRYSHSGNMCKVTRTGEDQIHCVFERTGTCSDTGTGGCALRWRLCCRWWNHHLKFCTESY